MSKKASKKLLQKYKVSGEEVSYRDKETGRWISIKKAIKEGRKVRRETIHWREGRKPAIDKGSYKRYKKEWKNTQIVYRDADTGKICKYTPFKLLRVEIYIEGKRVWRRRVGRVGGFMKKAIDEFVKQEDMEMFFGAVGESYDLDEEEMKEFEKKSDKEKREWDKYITGIDKDIWKDYLKKKKKKGEGEEGK